MRVRVAQFRRLPMKRWLAVGLVGATALVLGVHLHMAWVCGAGGIAYGIALTRVVMATKVLDAELKVRREWLANLEALNAMKGTFDAEDDEATRLDDDAIRGEWNV